MSERGRSARRSRWNDRLARAQPLP